MILGDPTPIPYPFLSIIPILQMRKLEAQGSYTEASPKV